MKIRHLRVGLAAAVLLATASMVTAGPGDLSPSQRAEFQRLVHQRNELYTQLKTLAGQSQSDPDWAETKWVQNQLDVVEQRLAEMAVTYDLTIPRRPVPTTRTLSDTYDPGEPTNMGSLTTEQRVELKKLVQQRNRLTKELARLDDRATDQIKNGANAVVTHAQQVSVQDQLDLVELRLAIMSTQHGVSIPPPPGAHEPAAASTAMGSLGDRNMNAAFSRGRERAVQQLNRDAQLFMTSLDFWAFLNN